MHLLMKVSRFPTEVSSAYALVHLDSKLRAQINELAAAARQLNAIGIEVFNDLPLWGSLDHATDNPIVELTREQADDTFSALIRRRWGSISTVLTVTASDFYWTTMLRHEPIATQELTTASVPLSLMNRDKERSARYLNKALARKDVARREKS